MRDSSPTKGGQAHQRRAGLPTGRQACLPVGKCSE